MNRKILATAVAGAIAPMAAQALDISVSGQVNRAIRFADNGADSDVQHIDGSAWGSRFWLTAEGEVMEGINAGAVMEQEFASNRGWEVDVDDPDADDSNVLRHSYLYFSGDFGKVSMGKTSPAGHNVMWQAYNDAYAGTEYSVDTNSSISVTTSEGDSAGVVGSYLPSITVSRANVLRYDTPSIGPLKVGVSVQKDGGEDHLWNFVGYLNQDFGAGTFKGGVHLADDVLAMGGGVKFSNGTSINAAWGNDDRDGQDFVDLYASIAHSWGNTTVALDYRTTDNEANKEGRSIGLGVNQSLGSGVSVYAGFNNYSFDDDTDMNLEDVTAFHIGSLVEFN